MTERRRDHEYRPDDQPPEQEPPRRIPLVTKTCEACDTEREIPADSDVCESCAEARAFAQIEAPEGGYRRGSDMDRL